MVQEVVKVVIEEGSQAVESLTEAISGKDLDKAKFFAHKFKALARHIGAARLSDKAAHLEAAVRKGDMESAPSLFADAKIEFEKVISFLSRDDWIETIKQAQCV